MTIAKETAVVYRGGGRRYFSLKAACHAEARKLVKGHLERKFPGECSCGESFDFDTGYSPPICRVHYSDTYFRLVKRVTGLLQKATKEQP